jgi:hypothetical protein
MRNLFSKLGMLVALALSAVAITASAQTFPYQNPTYIPSAVLAPVTLSAPGSVLFSTNGLSTVAVRVSGTCTSLASALQASNDGTNFTAINLYPVATGTTAPVAVAAASAPGFWKANVTGFTSVKMNVTALTAACVFALSGTQGDFNGVSF